MGGVEFKINRVVSNLKEGEEPTNLQEQLSQAQQRIRSLEEQIQKTGAGVPAGEPTPEEPLIYADQTLRRLVQRIAMILQAEKIVIMFYDRNRAELIGMPPAFGVEEERLPMFRVRATQGISGEVFREGTPIIFHDANNDARTKKDPFGILNVQNGISVPLVIEKRDEENRVIERTVIGVLHAFNKRHGEDFNDEDVRLLERMARNVGSIIANLQLYREVKEQRDELVQTFESLTAGLVLVSPDGRLSQMNASARAIFGVDEDVLGKQARDVLQHDVIQEVFRVTASGNEAPRQEITVSVAGAERFYEVQAALVRNDEGKDLGVVAILMDITDIKAIDKMKSSFVAMASHELRTPLTAIKGFVSTLLVDDEFSAEERREFYGIIDQECDRLTRLINDLLNTARIDAQESLKPYYTQVNIRAMLDKVVMMQRQTTTKHTITLDAPDQMPIIVGDEDKLDQILTNLLNNAIKYSPNGGQITVHAKNEGETLLVGVEDQGLGIPKEHLSKVFEKFHRVNNEDNRKIYGTGLGLFLVRHLVETVHLGKLWVESEPGKGSTFWFRIPTNLDIERAKEINE